MKKEWKQIVLKKGRIKTEYSYQISNYGEVKNKKGKKLKPFMRGKRKGSYPCVDLYYSGVRCRIDVHRIVAMHFIPNPKGKKEVNHLDMYNMNYRVDNLEWCSRSENMQHSYFMRCHEEL